MISVTLYTRKDCHLCEQAEQDLKTLQDEFPLRLVLVDIDDDRALQKEYALEIPVVEVGPYKIKAPFSIATLRMTLGAARDRQSQLEQIRGDSYRAALARSQTVTRADRASYWFARHYLAIFALFLFFYVGLPFLAPVLKQVGADGPAEVIYKIYSPLCHQWGFRSWFLFGEQVYYPHAAAGIEGVISFEAATGISDQTDPGRLEARSFEGNPVMGFKVALCERDVAIWGAMFLFAVLFAATGRRLPAIPWWLWILLGIVPPGLDGFSQLLSQLPYDWIQALLPYRESTPFLRSLTGFMFGWFTAWFAFPLFEETMADTCRLLSRKVIGTVSE
ncbi:MAG: glutaredoxin family protein [Anaerolineales bacterium]|nr:glutaredoxin family protein [Anaerolineales bacterium]